MVNKVLSGMLGMFSHDLAVDMGTAWTSIGLPGKGVVCREPSVVAVRFDRDGPRRLAAVGADAYEMLGRTPADMQAIHPLRGGAIDDFELVEVLLAHLLAVATGGHAVVSPRLALCIPFQTTDVERRALREAAEAAGARRVHLVYGVLASALGAQLPITQPVGNMIVDIGAGSTDIAVLSMGEIVYARSLEAAGDAMDEAVARWMREAHGLLVGPLTAERLKRELGRAVADGRGQGADAEAPARGRDLESGFPRAVTVRAGDLQEALEEPVERIVDAVKAALDHAPPELAGDILERGIVLTGGGARLRRLDHRLRESTGLPVVVAEQPESAAVLGSGQVLARPDLLRALCA